MRRLLLALLLFVAACAPKTIPPPPVTGQNFPEFLQPLIPPAYLDSPIAANQARAWTLLQAGDLRGAEHEFSLALRVVPAFGPAEDGLGYVGLAGKDAKSALPHFDRALAREPGDVSALVGRGQALIALDRPNEALTAFRSALAIDGSLTDIRQRVEVMTFRGLEADIASARAAARSGRADEAIQAYTIAIASSPESPFLYRELAAVERQKGDAAAALKHYREAASLDPTDARTLAQIGELLEASGDLEAADKAYSDSLQIEANPDVETRLEDVRTRMAIAKLPAEYRAIDQAGQVTRADLAALIGIRLAPLLNGERSRDAALITDVRSSWAVIWIMAVARAGVMEPFANHQFQPRTLVRRSDLAQAAARLLARISERQGQRAAWEGARLKFSDLAASHLAYPAASVAVAAGVMKTAPGETFQPSRPVTGAEAIESVDKLASIAGVAPSRR